MPRTDPLPSFCYCLEGDGRKYFVNNAVFPTTTSLVIDIPAIMDRQFITKIGSGLAPFQNGVLTMLDTSLEPVYRYGWCNTTVMQLAFPAVDPQRPDIVRLTVTFGVVDVQPVTEDSSPPSGGNVSTYSNTSTKASLNFNIKATPAKKKILASEVAHGRRRDPMVGTVFSVKIDNVVDTTFFSKMDAFSVGQGGTYTLVLTGSESCAAPFRTWLQNGGGKKGGKIEYFATNLNVAFRSEFTGLNIQSIYPAFPGAGPATIKLNFDSMTFYPVL